MTLSWLPPKDDGGSKITNYVIEKREANRKTWVRVSSEPKECTYTIPKLPKVTQLVKVGNSRPKA